MRSFFLTVLFCSILSVALSQRSTPVASLPAASSLPLPPGSERFVPEWEANTRVRSYVDPEKEYVAPAFAGCSYDPVVSNLPYESLLIPVEPGKKLTIFVDDVEYDADYKPQRMFSESVRAAGNEVQGAWYPKSHVIPGEILYQNKRPYQQIRIYPIQVGQGGMEARKADRIMYRLGNTADPSENQPSVFRDYATESVLNQGNWYKLGVLRDGVYKLDAGFFSSIGLNTASIDPAKIRIFGNGSGMVPQANSDFRYDDLVEHAIYVEGGSDGTFNSSDYVLFYGESPHVWKYESGNDKFFHEQHLYSDTNFYFLSIDFASGVPKRIQTAATAPAETYTPSGTRGVHFSETEKSNQIKSGRYWLGEKFDLITERKYAFYVPDAQAGNSIRITARVAGRSDVNTSFQIWASNTLAGSLSMGSTNVNDNEAIYYKTAEGSFQVNSSVIQGDSLRIRMVFGPGGSSRSEGWLDWIEVDYGQRTDIRSAASATFRLTEGTGPGAIAKMSFANASGEYRFWDISNPVTVRNLPFTLSGTQADLRLRADSMKAIIAFTGDFRSPVSGRKIQNQNLHGATTPDYIVITHPILLVQADSLAAFHAQTYGRQTLVVTSSQIYNEFSGGKQDVSAIRDFLKMFYDRSGGSKPGFVCLFGDGSYDYKNQLKSPTVRNFVPTYQSRNSNSPTGSYTSDDFYGLLDDNEGFWGEGPLYDGFPHQTHLIDVAIGRLPLESTEEASAQLKKIFQYAGSSESFGPWRNRVVLVADHKDGEGSLHVSQANSYTTSIQSRNPSINVDKIYMDNYPSLNTASGLRFPDGKNALLEALDEGSLIVNYTGHGGELAWSNSRILELADISAMKNGNRTPAIVTATCEFGRYDDQDRRSGAELLVIKENGGAIALFTTLRLVYASPNKELNDNFYHYSLTFDSTLQRWYTVGEIMAKTKNETFPTNAFVDINSRNFTLLGDPGLFLAHPEMRAMVTEINGVTVQPGKTDSIRSLALVEVKGRVTDPLGNFLPSYSGDLNITVFDKPTYFITNLSKFPFYWQKNRIFNGTASILGGEFSFRFVVPIDITYDEGFGKMSFYFSNAETDGSGQYSNLYVGGTDTSAVADNVGPEVDLYINDNTWIDGSITGPDPYLYAEVFDQSGINTVGSGIGHEVSAVIDMDESDVLVLNDHYAAAKDDYQRGTIRYQLKDLEEGEHEATLRVWDVANNVSESRTRFIIADNANMAITRLLNYPNPFTTYTEFWIGHNQAGKMMDATVRIYTTSGKILKTIQGSFFAEGNFYKELSWDGLDDYGDPIGRGVYIYQVTLRDPDKGEKATEFERLVILR
jgi:hypothetical protein